MDLPLSPELAPMFRPLDLAPKLLLRNRIAMLPLTRARAEVDGTPNDLMAEHFAQRASAGLMLTDSCAVSQSGRTYVNSPGIFTEEHAIGWKKVTDRVHAAGGELCCR
ncbi:putative oxidoreductase [Rhodococcus wratislaviensis NBRC 100605]|uniref:Putative oxidoreductase n=1 Tax=Rhodococcus wratislaviensis NBRC 100605 TaxID=1219028 RepID=X0QDB0_RHOWR|nr:putative oxidoreductase [Rhodococcus wratislaviensis NBRC 100605]